VAKKLIQRVEGPRLACYLSKADVAFWDRHWQQHFSPKIYTEAEKGNLGMFEELFSSYLPRQGRILEAGCGLGQYVLALKVRGYDIEGVDWSPETVNAVRSLYPELPVRTGDVTRLDVPNCYYDGYISLGVVEHRIEGPEPFLKEAYRVLKPGGMALISVPYFHPLRRLKARLGLYRGRPDGQRFYQYAFKKAEFTIFLQLASFKIIDSRPYDGFKGIKDEISLLRNMVKLRVLGWRLQRLLRSWEWAERNMGHMILFVCRKIS